MGGFWIIVRGLNMGIGGNPIEPSVLDLPLTLRIKRTQALTLGIKRTVPITLRTSRTVNLTLPLDHG